MLRIEENERLTQVGPGTPMGNLLRRYWQPIATEADLDHEEVMLIRRFGENLVLYKAFNGSMGLVQERCPHRSASLAYGTPDEEGIRCPYHGWYFNAEGRCLEQPFEETVNAEARFKDKIQITAYPVQPLGGLIWAYLGPKEKQPVLPRWEGFVLDGLNRTIGVSDLPCSWLQCMENSLDPVHFEWLHANVMNNAARRKGATRKVMNPAKHLAIDFDVFEFGIYKRRLLEGDDPNTSTDWLVGHPVLFPNNLAVTRSLFQIRVPIDDTHTWHINYALSPMPEGQTEPQITVVPVPYLTDEGRLITDTILGTDMLAWVSQGPITPRNMEHLGVSDKGVILYRGMLNEAMTIVEQGGDPPCLLWDDSRNWPMLQYHDENEHGKARAQFRLDDGYQDTRTFAPSEASPTGAR
jgi:5,5'-dehydrodivanillate O-demethylase oxygenase subunit